MHLHLNTKECGQKFTPDLYMQHTQLATHGTSQEQIEINALSSEHQY